MTAEHINELISQLVSYINNDPDYFDSYVLANTDLQQRIIDADGKPDAQTLIFAGFLAGARFALENIQETQEGNQ